MRLARDLVRHQLLVTARGCTLLVRAADSVRGLAACCEGRLVLLMVRKAGDFGPLLTASIHRCRVRRDVVAAHLLIFLTVDGCAD